MTNVPYQRNRPYGGTFFDSDEIADNLKSYFAEIGAELAKEISQDDAWRLDYPGKTDSDFSFHEIDQATVFTLLY